MRLEGDWCTAADGLADPADAIAAPAVVIADPADVIANPDDSRPVELALEPNGLSDF